MSLRVVDDGSDGYVLLSRDNRVMGWVRGPVVGVTGFEDEESAIAGAVRAYGTLVPWVERNRLKPLEPVRDEPVRLVHDGAHRWIAFGNVPVARLVGATPHDRADPGEHAFEIVLRGPVSDGIAIHAALIAHRVATGVVDAAEIAWRSHRSQAPMTRLGAIRT